jgi:hypothetical protein
MAELEQLVAACRHRVRQRAYEVLTCQLNEAQCEALDVTSHADGPPAPRIKPTHYRVLTQIDLSRF